MKLTPAKDIIQAVYRQCYVAFPGCIEFDDSDYNLPSREELVNFLEDNLVDKRKYTREWDCNWFVKLLVGQAADIGLPLGPIRVRVQGMRTLHKMCLTVTNDLQVWIIEPQTDEIIKPSRKIQILSGSF